jgi:hypothetical protein
VIFAGRFGGTIDFGGGPMSSVDMAVFVAKFAPDGTNLFSKGPGLSGGTWDMHFMITRDPLGDALLTGNGIALDFGQGPLAPGLFVARLALP